MENQTKTESAEHANDDRSDARVCSVLVEQSATVGQLRPKVRVLSLPSMTKWNTHLLQTALTKVRKHVLVSE